MSDNRPLSPHLQVYKPQWTSVLSILHRLTGVALTFGTLLLAWWLVATASGPEAYDQAVGFIGSWFGLSILAGWSFSLFYHLANGIRHLAWDAGYGFSLGAAAMSGAVTTISAVGLTILAWAIGLAAW